MSPSDNRELPISAISQAQEGLRMVGNRRPTAVIKAAIAAAAKTGMEIELRPDGTLLARPVMQSEIRTKAKRTIEL